MTVSPRDVESDLKVSKKILGVTTVIAAGMGSGILVDQVVSSAFFISLATMMAYTVIDGALTARWGYGWDKLRLFRSSTGTNGGEE
jgi:hypothetical protein